MSSLISLMAVAGDGLAAQSAGLDVSGQNVTNVNTPGYARRTVQLEERGSRGGVYLAGIGRSYDRFAIARVVTETGKQGAAAARSGALADTEALLAPGAGQTIGDRSSAFFASMSALSQN